MRLLKRKLALVPFDLEEQEEQNYSWSISETKLPIVKKPLKKSKSQARRKHKRIPEEEEKLARKNIVKNYGRAIANFALSDLFLPYIENDPLKSQVDWDEFLAFAKHARDAIQNAETMRDSFLIRIEDSERQIAIKRLFQKAAEIFIKYFSINWIFSGKLIYKQVYVQARGDLLRKILKPETLSSLSSPKSQTS